MRFLPGRGVARAACGRRGSALILTLLLTGAVGALALGAVYMSGNATLLGKAYDREQDYKYAADAAVAIGKSRLNRDPFALPDTGFTQLLREEAVTGADGRQVPGLTVSVWAGPSGSVTGQFGTYASVVSVARDRNGARFVRRLELTQESFAKFAYWTDKEKTPTGTTISFGGGDELWGPVWSNDNIDVAVSRAIFHDVVGTAGTISGKAYGTFDKGSSERQNRIELPTLDRLGALPGYAASGSLAFTAPTVGDETTVQMRLEFAALDLDGNGDSTGVDEGFVRAYTATASPAGVSIPEWVRGDYKTAGTNCGDWHRVRPDLRDSASAASWAFYPLAVHDDTSFTNRWFDAVWKTNGSHQAHRALANNRGGFVAAPSLAQVMSATAGQWNARYGETGAPAPRCYPGGDPRLAAVDRPVTRWRRPDGTFVPRATVATDTNQALKRGGDDTTFTRIGRYGSWAKWPGPAYAPLMARSAAPTPIAARRSQDELDALFPLYRGANSGYQGVIYANGTVGVSGTVRGRVTIFSNANIVFLDDVRYASDPASTPERRALGICPDVLGVLAAKNAIVADNGVNTPQDVSSAGAGSAYRSFDDSRDFFAHTVIMTLASSFGVQNYASGVATANGVGCQGTPWGRGCLFLTGGLIQDRRGAVALSTGTGFLKRYSYDRCAALKPPPFFPTTGRYLDNRYVELDPVGFDVAALFRVLTPRTPF